MPGEFASIDVEGHRRVGIEIIAWTRLRIILGNVITRAPDGKSCCRIVRACLPDATAAGFPRIILVLPGFTSGIARFGYHVPPPQLLARSCLQRRDPTARSRVSRAVCDEHLVFSRDRRRIESFPSAELVGRR